MQTIGISREKPHGVGRRSVLRTTIADQKHVRARRHFRLNYPDEVVECAVLLSCLMGVGRAASALDIRPSTLYRWFNKHRTRRSQFVVQLVDAQTVQAADAPRSMIVRCADKSFTSHPYILNQLRGRSERTRIRAESEHALAKHDVCSVATSDVGSTSNATANHPAPPSERILSTKTLIDSQYWSDWSCEKLAMRIGISKFQLINEFSAAFGKSPYHYLLGVRVSHAIELVRQRSDRTLAEIARSVGFGSPSSMQRAFKNFVGASPANFVSETPPPESRFAPTDSAHARSKPDRKGSMTVAAHARQISKMEVATEHHSVGI